MSSRHVPIEIDPVVIKMSDGKERRFLLSSGGINRLKRKYEVKTLKELLEVDESAATAILYEAMLDKEGVTEDQFNDGLPYNPANIAKAVGMLLGASFPDPPPAVETTTQTAVN